MKRSNIPMLRQHSHPPADTSVSTLSPTTTAATAGIKLNDPALRTVAVSTSLAAPKNNNVVSASTNPTRTQHEGNASGLGNISSYDCGNIGSSSMKTSRGKLPPFALVRTTNPGDKENNHNSKLPHYNESKSAAAIEQSNFCDPEEVLQQQQQQQPMMDLDYHASEPMMADEITSSESTPRNESMVGETRLPYNDDNHEMDNIDEFSINSEDSDDSDCSGGTVVKLPTGLTEVELNKYYWEICYGPGHAVPPPTALKCFPTKSW